MCDCSTRVLVVVEVATDHVVLQCTQCGEITIDEEVYQ